MAVDLPQHDDAQERLVACITSHQRLLFAYIFSLVHHVEDANDILQETNVVLWRKAQESAAAENFAAWARRIALMQIKAHRQKRVRDRHYFNDALLEQMAAGAEHSSLQEPTTLRMLRECVARLSQGGRRELQQRYELSGSVQAMAQASNRSVAAVSQSLYRIRNKLLECIRSRMEAESRS